MARREAESKTKRAARRAHKRQLANVIMRHMWNDADRLAQATSSASSTAAWQESFWESLNARYRRAVTVRGHFPTEQAALKVSTW